MLLGFAVTDTIVNGLYALSKLIIVVIPFYSFLVFGTRRTVVIFLGSLTLYVISGYLQAQGYWQSNPEVINNFGNLASWIESVLILSVISTIVVVFTRQYNHRLNGLIIDLEQNNENLRSKELSLEEEKEFTGKVLDSMPGVFQLYEKVGNNEYKIVKWNKNNEITFGHEDVDVYGNDPMAGIHKDYRHRVVEVINNLKSGEKQRLEVKTWNNKLKENSPWLHFEVYPIIHSGKEYVISTGINITDQKKMEHELKQERAFTNQVLDSLPGVFQLYKNTERGYKLAKWNRNSDQVFGHEGIDVSGSSPTSGIHKDYHKQIMQVVDGVQIGEKGRVEVKTWNHKLKEKSPWFYFEAYPIKYNNEDYFIAIGINITEKKKAEKLFHKEKEFSDQLLETLPGMFYLYEKAGDQYFLKRWNKIIEKETGYSSEELLDKVPSFFFDQKHQTVLIDKLQELDKNDSMIHEAPIKGKKGLSDYWHFVNRKLTNRKKQYILGFAIDISDRKIVERELEHRNMNLKDMLNDMKSRNQKLAEYAFINSHLLRAPLARILGLAELVSKEVILSEHQELLDNFRTSAEELDTIVTKINEILDQRKDLNRKDIVKAIETYSKKDMDKD